MTPPASVTSTRRNETTTTKQGVTTTTDENGYAHVAFVPGDIGERATADAIMQTAQDQFGNALARGWRMLHAMAAEAGGGDQIVDARRPADQRIVIERVHLIMAGPGADEAGRLEARHAMRQRRPEEFLILIVIGIEIGRIGIG